MFIITTATKKLLKLKKRIRAVQGGTSAGKTISILQILIDKAQKDYTCKDCGVRGCRDITHKISWKEDPKLTSVVSESFPHLKRGAMRDFLMIMQQHNYFDPKRWNKSESTYTFETGSPLEFFSADQPGKVRGPRRDRLFGNGVNNWANGLESFEQLEVRTKDEIWMDWNPTNEFWYYDKVANRDDCEHIILTYKDNEGLSKNIIDSIEQRKGRKGWWLVYGLGQLGEVEGKIYRGWEIIDEIPHEARLERYGDDFGYSNDPTAIVAIYSYNGGFILDEIAYRKGLRAKEIASIHLNEEPALVIGDSSDPRLIDDIKDEGVSIIGAIKKKEPTGNKKTYVEWGISVVQEQRISVTKRSTNIIKEYRNYLWDTDKDGNIMVNPSVPEHDFSHSMDAIRYGLCSLVKQPNFKRMEASEAVTPYYPELGI